ncbi:TetR/AcrR family transcriptional regulator [Streptomyces sp. H27-H1]|uniref:TetR/AcrR family transcriptional regulator n=1 Tax=Streptomyces sp. H27-H1 TaxID=2996461 RepID=UPI002271A60F|nr:TetR/AcrR family transcriptional regulator [Streptomyces sp. H27-H1]MCY0929677.1 TetR/AcrR family transcriptional regulator [Streptomyces sp. H27-H1]
MTTNGSVPGRRERKKAATRRALSDAALELFLARGYDKVKIAEIAEAADTAVTTLFAHFPAGKEALILDDSGEREASLSAAVRDRPDGITALDALHDFFGGRAPFADDLPEEFQRRMDLVMSTPALRDYARQVWIACQGSLAGLLAEAAGRTEPDDSLYVLARYVLETPDLASTRPDRKAALSEAFTRLKQAWPGL